jgi:2-oxoglutarate dehydrogenase complex dehydrogenase (E1) component-like enzyme
MPGQNRARFGGSHQRMTKEKINLWRDFHGPNAGYVLELYNRYQQNPDAVDTTTRRYFEGWSPMVDGAAALTEEQTKKIVGVMNLAHAIRAATRLATPPWNYQLTG